MKTFLAILFCFQYAFPSDDHGHDNEHAHSDEHEESQENPAIGFNKGITEKGPLGFKLSPEALEAFELKTSDIHGKVVTVSRQALVQIKDSKSVYRVRDRWIKRVPVKILGRNLNQITIELPDYSPADKIIISGIGFVRTSELIVEEGASHAHSH